MPTSDLNDKTILVTRPKAQANLLKRAIESAGGQVVLFPTIVIKPILIHQTTQPNSGDFALFLSANAVKHAPDLRTLSYQKIIAIGPGTAAALQQKGLCVDALPKKFSSEGLLELPLLNNMAGKTVALFCGENTRPYLSKELTQRGAKVFPIICYRREKPIVDKKIIKTITDQPMHAIVSTSMESLQNLYSLFSAQREWLRRIPLIVISKGMQNLAKSYGFNSVILADNATEPAIMKAFGVQ